MTLPSPPEPYWSGGEAQLPDTLQNLRKSGSGARHIVHHSHIAPSFAVSLRLILLAFSRRYQPSYHRKTPILKFRRQFRCQLFGHQESCCGRVGSGVEQEHSRATHARLFFVNHPTRPLAGSTSARNSLLSCVRVPATPIGEAGAVIEPHFELDAVDFESGAALDLRPRRAGR